jgi:hypothetical protein
LRKITSVIGNAPIYDREEKNSLNRIEVLIADKIKKIDSTLDLQGADRKMLQLACKDFANYMKFSCRSAYNLRFEEKLERFSDKEHSELDAFLTVWTGMWVKKWQERVKLFMGERSKDEHNLQTVLAAARSQWQTLDCKEELIDSIESTLINNGEICGTQNLAEYTIKTELAKKGNLDISDKTQAITFLNNVLRRAHEIAKTSGPLMFVEVNKTYYNQATTPPPV